ncbi:MAG: nuclear transport factor 2 family protein [Longimicrobiales bacterium]|nr:nuclear transport factor 2 family protein [Longimicrobiales bacterium]
MRLALPTALAAALTIGCQPAPSPTLTPEASAVVDREVRAAAGALIQAMNGGDSASALAFFRDAPEFFYLGCTDYILGGQTFRRLVGPYYQRTDEGRIELEVVMTQVLAPTVAVVSLRGASRTGRALFATQVWRREADGWQVSAEHESWPGCAEPRDPHPFTGMPSGGGGEADAEPGT